MMGVGAPLLGLDWMTFDTAGIASVAGLQLVIGFMSGIHRQPKANAPHALYTHVG